MKTIAQQLNVTEFPFEIKDSSGREIYSENSDGSWSKCEYDSNGNQIYIENSTGFWCRREFDSNDRETYVEYSTGYWCRREYDSNGKEVYYQNSDGNIKDNRTTCNNKVVEIEGKKYKLIEI